MLRDLFANNKNIIINTDIDGFLCGMLLQKYFNCKVVGFSNSKKTIWVDSSVKSIYDPIYIDLYVVNPDVTCIEQHIIGYDEEHNKQIASNPNKINPNLLRNKSFTVDYPHKYPFGTVHFLIALMEKEGIDVDLPCMGIVREFNNIELVTSELILRADDALYSTQGPYRENAIDWWGWLTNYSNRGRATKKLVQAVMDAGTKNASEIKNRTGRFFKSFGCDGIDGSFDNITQNDGTLIYKIDPYINMLSAYFDVKLDVPHQLVTHEGLFRRMQVMGRDKETLERITHMENLFSYAFIYGPFARYPNFSYTTDME